MLQKWLAKNPVTVRAFEKRRTSYLLPIQPFLRFGLVVTELGYLNIQFILIPKAVVYRGLQFCCNPSYAQTLQSVFLWKTDLIVKRNSEIEHKPNLAKFKKKFNSLSRYVTVRASNAETEMEIKTNNYRRLTMRSSGRPKASRLCAKRTTKLFVTVLKMRVGLS